jgi:hypothetical protein
LDLKIGFLHSYPNGDLAFENFDDYASNIINERFEPRTIGGTYDNSYESASMSFTIGGQSNAGYSVRTPYTYGEKSVYSKVSVGKLNKT